MFSSHSLCSPVASSILGALLLALTTTAGFAPHGGFSMTAVQRPRHRSTLNARGSVQDSVQANSMFYLPVEIGTPPQMLYMLPDSGAPSLVVSNLQLSPNSYNPNISSTAHQLPGYTYANCFGSGHCGGGVVYNDTVTVGSVTVTMAFEVSTHTNGQGSSSTDQGDFGLNFDKSGMTTSPTKVPTWLQNVLPQLESSLFTIDFNQTAGFGTFDFGFIDSSKYTGEIGYTPVNGSGGGEWAFQFSGFGVGNGPFNDTQGWEAIVDSGTGGSGFPRFVVDGYFQNISGATYDSGSGTYKFPCSTALPDFVFGIDGSSYRGVITSEYLLGNQSSVGDGMCHSTLVTGTGTVIFGQNLIASQFVVLDYGNARVGFASKTALTADQPPTTSSTATATSSTAGVQVMHSSTVAATSTAASASASPHSSAASCSPSVVTVRTLVYLAILTLWFM